MNRILSVLVLLTLAAGMPPPEGTQTRLFVGRFGGTDGEAARELFVNHLAATQKFIFVSDPAQAELLVGGTLGGRYLLQLSARRPGESPLPLAPIERGTLDEASDAAARAVAGLHKRSGYVIKRSGDRVVIARGGEDGVARGQRYLTSDTGEVFEIDKVAPHTAEGVIVAQGGEPMAEAVRPIAELGKVDVVFVIDTTASMQPEIDAVRNNCLSFARQLESKGIDARLGLVTFTTEVTFVHSPATPAQFREWINPLAAADGGDETPFAGLEAAVHVKFRPDAKRVIVLITDEAAYDAVFEAGGVPRGAMTRQAPGCSMVRPTTRADAVFGTGLGQRVFRDLTASHTTVFTVTLDDDEGVYRYLATRTGGTFHDLMARPDLTYVLGTVGKRIEGMFTEL